MSQRAQHGGARPGAGRKRVALDDLVAHGAPAGKLARLKSPPEPEVIIEPKLPLLLASVTNARETFAARMQVGVTVALDESGVYEWQDGDAATRARAYARAVTTGAILACRNVQLACKKFLDDLEHGAERGLFFDPFEARNIVRFFDEFSGFTLLEWQVFFVVQLFSWKRGSGLRRFTEAWLSIGRKNGKSSMLGGIGLFCLIADCEPRAEVYSVACTRDQARIIWRSAKFMCETNPELKQRLRLMERSIVDKTTSSFCQPLSSDTGVLDGLNSHVVLEDEIHMHPSRDLTDRMIGSQAARKQPLLLSATTAGESRETFAFDRNEFFVRLLEGIITADNYLVYIAELDEADDHRDAKNWVKANPSIGALVREDFLKAQLAEIEDQPTKLNAFKRFHCNRWVEKVAGHSLAYDRIEACGVTTTQSPLELQKEILEKLWHASWYGGYDHGETDDLSAFVRVIPDVVLPGTDSKRRIVIPMYWMPEAHLQLREKQWGVPLSDWVRKGFIKLIPGDLNDMNLIGHDILKIIEKNRPVEIGFDRYGGIRQAMGELINLGFKCVEVPQTSLHLTESSKFLKNSVLKGELCHLNNPVFKWNLANVELEVDERNSLMKPVKAGGDTRRKIDGVQAAVTALARWMDPEGKPMHSVYSERGILSI
jgi:phage terminase large subunit-like protein